MTLVLACGDDGSAADGVEGSTTAETTTDAQGTSSATTTEATTEPTTAGTAGTTGSGTTDPDGTSGPPSGGTPGCGLDVPAIAGTIQIDVGGVAREYLLVVPDGYDPNTPMPLVFAYHGRGGTADLARLYFGVEAAANGDAIFVYPQGLPLASMGGQTGWDLAPTGGDVELFDAMLEELGQGACIDLERVFVTGHSFGGYMSNALGCFRSSVIRAIGPVAGGPPFGACEDDDVAAWIAHGTLDQVVPYSQGEQSRDALLSRNGCDDTASDVDPAPCVSYDGCADGLPVVWCSHAETDLQGHMWPRFAGPAIWAFFDALPSKP